VVAQLLAMAGIATVIMAGNATWLVLRGWYCNTAAGIAAVILLYRVDDCDIVIPERKRLRC
jgi:hypothetical protein